MRNKNEANHVLYRDGVYNYVRRVPYDLTFPCDVKRLCFSLKTKSASAAVRASKSINQRLKDYWLGLRLQNMDIPAIQVVKSGSTHENDTLLMSEACELYLRLKGVGKDKVFIRTANRNTHYVTKLLGDRPISSCSSNEALWASKRLLEANNDSIFAFPRYCSETVCKANSASGGLNKWSHQYVRNNCVIHSFRHSLRDRLRAVECPLDIIDAIGGWKTAGVGH